MASTKKKVTVVSKARPIPDPKNRPTTKIPGMKKSNTRMEATLKDKQGKNLTTRKKR